MRRLPLYLVALLGADALLLSFTPDKAPEQYVSYTLAVAIIAALVVYFARNTAIAGFLGKVGVGAGLVTLSSAGLRWLLIRVIDGYERMSRYAETPQTEEGATRFLFGAIIIALIVLVWRAGARDIVKPELQRMTTFLVRLAQPQAAVSQPRPAAPSTMLASPPARPAPPRPPARPTPPAAALTAKPAPSSRQRALPQTSTATAQEDILAMLLDMENAKANAAFSATRPAVHCNACGHKLQKNSFFCSYCGASIMGTKPADVCNGCGAQWSNPTQQFCHVCGESRTGGGETPAQPIAARPAVALPVYKPPVT